MESFDYLLANDETQADAFCVDLLFLVFDGAEKREQLALILISDSDSTVLDADV